MINSYEVTYNKAKGLNCGRNLIFSQIYLILYRRKKLWGKGIVVLEKSEDQR